MALRCLSRQEDDDYHYSIKQIEQYMMGGASGKTSPADETAILEILSQARKDSLNLIIQSVDAEKLFGDPTDSVFSNLRPKLLRLVSKKRVHELDVQSKKIIICSLRKRIARSGPKSGIA